jgi:hypothetical protein
MLGGLLLLAAVAVAFLLFQPGMKEWGVSCAAKTDGELQRMAQDAIAKDLRTRFPKAHIVVGKLPVQIYLRSGGALAYFTFDIVAPMRETFGSAAIANDCKADVSYSARIVPRL